MSGRPRRRQSGTGPASPAQQEEVGEGELARVLAAVEALNPFSLRWVLVPCVFDTREANCAGAAEDSRLGSTSRCGLQSDQGVC